MVYLLTYPTSQGVKDRITLQFIMNFFILANKYEDSL